MRLPHRNSTPSNVYSSKIAPAFVALAAVAVVGFGYFIPSEAVRADTPASAQTVETPMGRAPLSFADLVERVKPSVVSVSVINDGGASKMAENDKKDNKKGGGNFNFPDLPPDHPLHDFFKHLPKEFGQQEQRPKIVQGQGSGFVISPDGYVVTNNHVIDGATKIQVTFDNDETKYDAKLVGTDPRTDVALLKIESNKTFPAVKLSTKTPRVGDWALAVGNPFGLGGTVTAGIVSALARDIGSGPYDYMQIDAAVNRGNSGGPTFNLDGDVIGVNTAIFSPSGGNVGIAFDVPAKTVQEVITQLKATGTVKRGWLGVKIQNVDDDTAASLGLKEAHGALVSEVTPNGPAAAAGIKTQDAILQVNDEKIVDSRDLARKIAELSPDSPVNIKVWRNNAEKVIKVKLGLFPKNAEALMNGDNDDNGNSNDNEDKPSTTELSQLGVTLMPARTGSNSEGVAIAEVDPSSDAAEKGLKAGDVILEISGQTVKSPADVISGIKKAQDLKRTAVLLHIQSSDQKRFVAVQLATKKG
ncbi:Do family serine endopeptidase [Hyphomicrobium sp.]|jgi:serine protease Do|uniref:Do family serine endopeptidase n=1 Tax=Hyphomicrobium sp. TaxID=82 RepID=UPI002CC9A170|nr:Do family serine endopeptidase [Hyphomicrobium sp.]HVZ05153.1 Do family serine endopeptidase [Hyphomicrobium sp.]